MRADKKSLELYFHIPFCARKCSYCDFLSFPGSEEMQADYMDALFSELEGRAAEYSDYDVVSVFIGGGTPSIIKAQSLAELLERTGKCYSFAENVEITMEINPGTVDEGKLRACYQAGVNRLSIGLQSANDVELERLGRIHDYRQFLETYELARRVGFTNINVDVMSALPGQSMASYVETLYQLLRLQPPPEHISAYSLIVEEGTPFAEWEKKGLLDLPDEDTEREMYEETERILGKAGFERYEISNYARPGFECRHNCGYWSRTDYVGFGIGAASLVGEVRFKNESSLQKYLLSPTGCRVEAQELSVQEQMEETMFLGLRMTKGVCTKAFEERFGQKLEEVYGSVISRNVEEGLLSLAKEEGEVFCRLTKRGLDVSNYVMSQFLFD